MSSSSSSVPGTPRRTHSRSSSISSSQSSIRHDTRVHVFVRARPLEELAATGNAPLDYPSEKEIRLTDQKQETTYKFDRVFSPEATNQEVCNVICSPLIETVLDGYNGSFLVYGQTGTGKTFTVHSENGLIPTTITELFRRVENDTSHSYRVFMSYMQIYHERIYDLLDPTKDADMQLREHPSEGIKIEGLTEFEITSTKEAEHLIAQGKRQLIVAETRMVRISSRSHSLCLIRVEKKKIPTRSATLSDGTTIAGIPSDFIKPEDACWKGKLYLCDLAGSERLKKSGVSGDRLKEARYINSSLLELGNVIHALSASRYQHVPFRNSTLTRLLKESLGGNSRASLMICISSAPDNIGETKCSLNFGQRALRVTKSSSPNIEHIAPPYMIMKPRHTTMQLPKIDYKALSEYLAKKLKELETAYNNEKQGYIKMQEEMAATKKGVSRIPVPLARRNSTWKEDRLKRPQEIGEVERENSAEIVEERRKPQIKNSAQQTNTTDSYADEVDGTPQFTRQKTHDIGTDTIDSVPHWQKVLRDKETIIDDNDILNDPIWLQYREIGESGRGRSKDYTTMSSQTDENDNCIIADDMTNLDRKENSKHKAARKPDNSSSTETRYNGKVNMEQKISGTVYKEPNISGTADMEPNISGMVNMELNISEEPCNSGMINTEPIISGRMNKEPNVSNTVNIEPNISGLVNKEPETLGMVNMEPKSSGLIKKEPKVSGTMSKEPNILGMVNLEPKSSGMVNTEAKISGMVDTELSISSRVNTDTKSSGTIKSSSQYITQTISTQANIGTQCSNSVESSSQTIHRTISTQNDDKEILPCSNSKKTFSTSSGTYDIDKQAHTDENLTLQHPHVDKSSIDPYISSTEKSIETTGLLIPATEHVSIDSRETKGVSKHTLEKDEQDTSSTKLHEDLPVKANNSTKLLVHDTDSTTSISGSNQNIPSNLPGRSNLSHTQGKIEKVNSSVETEEEKQHEKHDKKLNIVHNTSDEDKTNISVTQDIKQSEDGTEKDSLRKPTVSHNFKYDTEPGLSNNDKVSVMKGDTTSINEDKKTRSPSIEATSINQKTSSDAPITLQQKTITIDDEEQIASSSDNTSDAKQGEHINVTYNVKTDGNYKTTFMPQERASVIDRCSDSNNDEMAVHGRVIPAGTTQAFQNKTIADSKNEIVNPNETVAASQAKRTLVSQDKVIAAPQRETFAATEDGNFAVSQNRTIAVSQEETIVVSQNRTTAVSQEETIAVPWKETTAVPQKETIVDLRNETIISSQEETIAIPRHETIAVSMDETIVDHKAETIPAPKAKTIAVPKVETIIVPRDEAIAVPRHENIVISQEETIAVPQEETVAAPQEETIAVIEDETSKISRKETITVPQDETIVVLRDETFLISQDETMRSPPQHETIAVSMDESIEVPKAENIAASKAENIAVSKVDTIAVFHDGANAVSQDVDILVPDSELLLVLQDKSTFNSEDGVFEIPGNEITLSAEDETTLVAGDEETLIAANLSGVDKTSAKIYDSTAENQCYVSTSTNKDEFSTNDAIKDSPEDIHAKNRVLKCGSTSTDKSKYSEKESSFKDTSNSIAQVDKGFHDSKSKIPLDLNSYQTDQSNKREDEPSQDADRIKPKNTKETITPNIIKSTDQGFVESQAHSQFDDSGFESFEPETKEESNNHHLPVAGIVSMSGTHEVTGIDYKPPVPGEMFTTEGLPCRVIKGENVICGHQGSEQSTFEKDKKATRATSVKNYDISLKEMGIKDTAELGVFKAIDTQISNDARPVRTEIQKDGFMCENYSSRDVMTLDPKIATAPDTSENVRQLPDAQNAIEQHRSDGKSARDILIPTIHHYNTLEHTDKSTIDEGKKSRVKGDDQAHLETQSQYSVVEQYRERKSQDEIKYPHGQHFANDRLSDSTETTNRMGVNEKNTENKSPRIAEDSNIQPTSTFQKEDNSLQGSIFHPLQTKSHEDVSDLSHSFVALVPTCDDNNSVIHHTKPLLTEQLVDTSTCDVNDSPHWTDPGFNDLLHITGSSVHKAASIEEIIIPQTAEHISNSAFDSLFGEWFTDKDVDKVMQDAELNVSENPQSTTDVKLQKLEGSHKGAGQEICNKWPGLINQQQQLASKTNRTNQAQRLPCNVPKQGDVPLASKETGKTETYDLLDLRVPRSADRSEQPARDTDGGEDQFSVLQGTVTVDPAPIIKEAIIVDNREVNRQRFRPVSIGEARKLSSPADDDMASKEISDFLKGTVIEKVQRKELKSVEFRLPPKNLSSSRGSAQFKPISNTPLLELSPVSPEAHGYDSSTSFSRQTSASPSPSCTSTDSEIGHALREKEKLKTALNSVKTQYEGLLKEFDRIIASNTGESEESAKISKESYQIALQCKEELETELSKAKEQLALVIAAHEEQKEGLMWQTSDSEFSEETDSVFPDDSEEGENTPRATSTPISTKDIKSLKTDIPELDVSSIKSNRKDHHKSCTSEYSPTILKVPQEATPRSSNSNIASDLLSLAYKVTRQTDDDGQSTHNTVRPRDRQKSDNDDASSKSKSSEIKRSATIPRRRSSTRRPRTMILEEGGPTDFKWINKRSSTSEEQAKRNHKLTLQAIENAELKKELLLTKLEKIRLEAMLSCVMMRLSPNEVDNNFRKISVNSITSSSSTLRSTTSMTNIPQIDTTSPFQPMSPIRRRNPRVGSSLSGHTSSPTTPRVRFGETHKGSSTISPRSSSLFGHLSQLTQSSLSPSSIDFDISSCASSEFPESPVPLERFSPYGQDDEDFFNSPSSKKGKPDGQPEETELAVAYKGKNKLLLTACLPFLRKKKGSRRNSKEDAKARKDSYGADC